jgi:uncharacterized protein
MKDLLKIAVYSTAAVMLGCLLAPPLYWAGRYAVDHNILPQIERFGFQKYFNRAMLLAACLLIWPYLRWARIRSWRDLRLQANPNAGWQLLQGALIGIVGLWGVAGSSLVIRQTQFEKLLTAEILGAALTAIVVSLIEEIFFRGVLLGALRRRLPQTWALWILTTFFAVLHFLKPNPQQVVYPIHWTSGFKLLRHVFWQFHQPQLVLAGFVTLMLVGYILGYAVIKTRSLAFAFGLHAGWVFALRSFDFATKQIGPNTLVLGPDLITGILPLLLLVGTYLVVRRVVNVRR